MSDITPSQTVGPFFAYGLAPHNRCDWKPSRTRLEGNHGATCHAGRHGHADPHRGPRARRRRQADQRRHGRNLAGRRARPLRPSPREAAAESVFKGFGRSATDKDGRLQLPHHQARRGAGPRRQAAGAAYRGLRLLARHAAADLHPDLFRRRGGERRRSDPGAGPADRRGTLDCPQTVRSGEAVYRFDIRVQGENETVSSTSEDVIGAAAPPTDAHTTAL